MTPRFTATLLLGTALSAPAFAQEAPTYNLDEIVIYHGALEPRSADTTGQSVTVLSTADLEAHGHTGLAALIAQAPGVGILSRGPMGSQTGFTIRGVSQNYVKVLVDGIDVSDPSGTQVAADLGRFSTFNYGRVEIMRGSQSAVYGGQAVGGVINLDTPRPTKDGISQGVQLEAGSYHTANAAYNFGWKQGEDELAVQISKIYTSGFSAADEINGNTEADGYKADRISMTGQKRVAPNLLIGFAGFAQNDTGEYDETAFGPNGSYPVDGTPDEVAHARTRGARAFAKFDIGALSNEFSLSYFKIKRSNTGSDSFGATFYDYDGTRRKAEWVSHFQLGQGKASLGLDRTLENYESDSTYGGGQAQTRTTGVFGEYALDLRNGVSVVGSLRHDSLSSYGDQTTGRLGVTWQVNSDLLLRSSIANGYRAPSGYELYGVYGDPTLRPEKSRSFDLGLEQKFGEQTLTATLFRIDVDNLIDYSYPSYYQTSGTATRQGLELGLKGALTPKIDYQLGYTYIDPKNPAGLSAGSTWNASFGRHTLTAALDAQLTDRITVGGDLRFVADRQTLPDYGVANAQITYDLSAGKQVYLRVENLFDQQYELWPGYGTSDRAAYVGLRATF
ncbi:vitamin B12 transporter [Thioclava dalianensis]|nr:TonB-dependent receptor [Thioclava dalianensis]SFN42570.1 vitamin B12 transporter [Thioclava dalianensis]